MEEELSDRTSDLEEQLRIKEEIENFKIEQSNWLPQVKEYFRVNESKTLINRTNKCITLLKDLLTNLCKSNEIKSENINLILSPTDYKENDYNKNINTVLNKICEWNGLQLIKIKKFPKNFKEFLLSADNWLRGKRAKLYADHFYPNLIVFAKNYIGKICVAIYGDNMGKQNELYKYLLNKFVYKLFSIKVRNEDNTKKINLICFRSIQYKRSLLRNLLENIITQYNNDNINENIFLNNLSIAKYFKDSYKSVNLFNQQNNNNTININNNNNNNQQQYNNYIKQNTNNIGYGSHRQMFKEILNNNNVPRIPIPPNIYSQPMYHQRINNNIPPLPIMSNVYQHKPPLFQSKYQPPSNMFNVNRNEFTRISQQIDNGLYMPDICFCISESECQTDEVTINQIYNVLLQ